MTSVISHNSSQHSSPITIVLPQFPPTICGVGDYTFNLVTAWSNISEFNYLVVRGVDESKAQYPQLAVHQLECNKELFVSQLKKLAPQQLLIQYSGYGFHSLGCPVWLSKALTQWRKERDGKLIIVFHELWNKSPWWNKHFLLQQGLHRWSIKRLASIADGMFTTTSDYVEWLKSFSPKASVKLLPVGSNIVPNQQRSHCARQSGIFVLFGMQGNRVNTLQLVQSEIKSLYNSRRLKKLLLIGGGNSEELEIVEKKLLEQTLPRDSYCCIGIASSQVISTILSQAEFGISTQSWQSFTKSGTFMAYAAHGLNILSPYAAKQSQKPFCWLTHPSELEQPSDFLNNALKERSRNLQLWYNETCNWSVIAQEIKDAFTS